MKPWTMHDLRLLRNLAPTHSRAQLAVILGRSPGAVGDKAWRLGIPLAPADKCRHPWEVVDAVRAAYAQGELPATIAKRFQLPHKTVCAYVYGARRMG